MSTLLDIYSLYDELTVGGEHNIYTVILCQYVDVSEERGSGLHNVPTFSINQHLSSARPSAGDINRLLNR